MYLKEQILMVAFNLFSQYGIKGVSMDDIARTAAVSKRTLYGFFDDKESLLMEGLAKTYKNLFTFLSKVESGPLTSIDIVLLMYEEFMKRPPLVSPKFYDDLKKFPKALETRETERTKMIAAYMRLYKRGVKEGVFQTGINFGILALLVKEQLKITPLPESFSKHSCSEVYETVLITFLRGICTDKGREVLEHWANARTYHIQ